MIKEEIRERVALGEFDCDQSNLEEFQKPFWKSEGRPFVSVYSSSPLRQSFSVTLLRKEGNSTTGKLTIL